MTNPFDRDDETFHVLVNGELQYSLWPTFTKVPPGWSIALADTARQRCLEYVDEHWTDLRPKSLREVMDHGGPPGRDGTRRDTEPLLRPLPQEFT